MKKGLLLFIAVAMLLSISSIALAEDDTVKIGVIFPLSGAQALTGFEYTAGCEFAKEMINNSHPEWAPLLFAETKGIPNLGGKKIELVYGDSQATPERGQNEAERLITQEGVVALIGANTSSVTLTASQVAERYGIPFICDSASSPTLTERGFQYFFRVFGHDGIFVDNVLTAIKEYGEEDLGTELKTMVILNENSLWGSDIADLVRNKAPEYGFEVIDQIAYPSSTTQVNAEVQRVIAKNPDILFQASYVSDAILFIKTFKEQGWVPKMYMYGDGKPLNFSYQETLAEDGWFTAFRTGYTEKEDAVYLDSVLEYFREMNPKLKFNEGQASATTAIQTVVDAINRAGSTDPEEMRKALMETNIPGEQIIFPYEGVKFDEKGQNYLARAIIAQVHEDYDIIDIWPEEFREGKFRVFPAWDER